MLYKKALFTLKSSLFEEKAAVFQNLCFCCPNSPLLQSKTYPFGTQKLCYWNAKAIPFETKKTSFSFVSISAILLHHLEIIIIFAPNKAVDAREMGDEQELATKSRLLRHRCRIDKIRSPQAFRQLFSNSSPANNYPTDEIKDQQKEI